MRRSEEGREGTREDDSEIKRRRTDEWNHQSKRFAHIFLQKQHLHRPSAISILLTAQVSAIPLLLDDAEILHYTSPANIRARNARIPFFQFECNSDILNDLNLKSEILLLFRLLDSKSDSGFGVDCCHLHLKCNCLLSISLPLFSLCIAINPSLHSCHASHIYLFVKFFFFIVKSLGSAVHLTSRPIKQTEVN